VPAFSQLGPFALPRLFCVFFSVMQILFVIVIAIDCLERQVELYTLLTTRNAALITEIYSVLLRKNAKCSKMR